MKNASSNRWGYIYVKEQAPSLLYKSAGKAGTNRSTSKAPIIFFRFIKINAANYLVTSFKMDSGLIQTSTKYRLAARQIVYHHLVYAK